MPDIQNFLKENSLNVQSNYHVVDDLSTIAMVANGFGICLMPQMVMRDIPYEVDCYPVQPICRTRDRACNASSGVYGTGSAFYV